MRHGTLEPDARRPGGHRRPVVERPLARTHERSPTAAPRGGSRKDRGPRGRRRARRLARGARSRARGFGSAVVFAAGSVLRKPSAPSSSRRTRRRRHLRSRKLSGSEGLDRTGARLSRRFAAGFRVHHRSEEVRRERFATPRAVLRHLRATGVTGTHDGFRWTKRSLFAFEEAYRARFAADDGEESVHLTYHPVILLLEKPS